MTDRQSFILAHQTARQRAVEAVQSAPEGYRVLIAEPKRSDSQADRFYAICTDLAKSGMEWCGKRRSKEDWKVLLLSAHAKATNEHFELTVGLEGEMVNLRESTTSLSVKRGASLIDYAESFCAMNGIKLKE